MENKKHSELARGMTSQSTLAATFENNSLRDQVATFIAEHNIPFLAADHFTKLTKVMFPDSTIAQDFLPRVEHKQQLS